MFRFCALFLTLLLLTCQQNNSQLEKEAPRQENTKWQDRALFLAGLPASEEFEKRPEIAKILKLPGYLEHRRQMERFWSSVERQRVKPMTTWWRQELSPRIDGLKTRTALYPLSGGDILNLKLMYPDAQKYVMIAMEKPGQMPDPSSMSYGQLYGGLASVQKMLSNIQLTGYFFSRWMNQYMNPERFGFYGTLPTVSIFLVRLGHRIQDVQETCVNNEGQLTAAPAVICHIPGYRIQFIDGRTGESKELIYLSTVINNSLFSRSTPGGKYIHDLGEVAIMMKAAVYLFHRQSQYEGARYLLENAEVIVQDDSGIPYRYYDRRKWDITLYGTYLAPLPGMAVYPQRDLILAYRRGSRRLPFAYGYGPKTIARASGLMVAFSRDSP